MTRVMILAAIVVAMLVVAAPAFAFDGARNDFTPVASCAACHDTGGIAPAVVGEWSMTGHAEIGDYDAGAANAYPVSRGPSCAGCHAGNYTPSKAQGVKTPWPAPTPTATPTLYPPAIANQNPSGDAAYTQENFIDEAGAPHANAAVVGCSSCHYNQSKAHSSFADDELYGDLANAEICGQCHNRYAVNKSAFPTLGVIPGGTAGTTTPSYPVAYNPFTTPLSDVIITDSPALNPGNWWAGGQSTRAHGEGARQYAEWVQEGEGHAEAISGQLPIIFGGIENVPDSCLECHSADYRIMEEAGKWSSSSVPKYGVTCQACHTPHSEGPTKATWNEHRDPQLKAPQTKLCNECHNSEIPEDTEFEPGQEVHHPMKEMMAGYGAIDVPEIASVHEGKCVQCHMVPTGYEHTGEPGTSANHVFAIVTPEEAASQTYNTAAGPKNMPYSSCSTCHSSPGDPLATYLQDTIEDRQAFIDKMLGKIHDELIAGANRLGYPGSDLAALRNTIDAKADKTASEVEWLKSWTNMEMVHQEGSMGIHNWAYANAIVNKALDQAESVRSKLASISIATNPAGGPPPTYTPNPIVTFPNSVAFGGTITGGDQALLAGGMVKLWAKRNGGTTWNVVASTYVEGEDSNEWVIDYVPRYNAVYKAQFAGNDTYDPIVTSWEVGVDVRWQVTFKASKSKVKRNTKISYSGKVNPMAAAGALAGVQKVVIQRKVSGNWKTWKSTAILADGSYKITVKMTKKGKYVLRGFFAGDNDGATPPVYIHLDGWSASKTITVK